MPTIVLGAALFVALLVVAILVAALVTSGQSSGDARASSSATSPIESNGPGGNAPAGTASSAIAEPMRAAEQACSGYASFVGTDVVAHVDFSADLSSAVVDGFSETQLALTLPGSGLTTDDTLDLHKCILDALGAPTGTVERMRQTRALDGTQQEEWDNYKVTWTFHPDQGLDAVFSYTD